MRAEVDTERIQLLMQALGQAPHQPGKIYLTGGASAVLLGWRAMTVDVDCKLYPEPAGIFDAIPRIKDELDINIELAAPDDFIPPLPGWQERSQFIETCGQIEFYHYDFYGQALAKIERYHARDEIDVAEMLTRGLVQTDRLLALFEEIEPDLKRYPAIEPAAFRERVEKLTTRV